MENGGTSLPAEAEAGTAESKEITTSINVEGTPLPTLQTDSVPEQPIQASEVPQAQVDFEQGAAGDEEEIAPAPTLDLAQLTESLVGSLCHSCRASELTYSQRPSNTSTQSLSSQRRSRFVD